MPTPSKTFSAASLSGTKPRRSRRLASDDAATSSTTPSSSAPAKHLGTGRAVAWPTVTSQELGSSKGSETHGHDTGSGQGTGSASTAADSHLFGHYQPLDKHPQLFIIPTPLAIASSSDSRYKHVEYRVYNWRTLPSGRVIRGDGTGVAVWAVFAMMIYLLRDVWRAALAWGIQGQKKVGYEFANTALRGMSAGERALILVLSFVWLRLMTSTVLYRRSLSLYEQVEPPLGSLGIFGTSAPSYLTVQAAALSLIRIWIRDLSTASPDSAASSDATGGRFLIPLSTTRAFVPLSDISTIIINEGLTRWNVRYYLAVVKKRGAGVAVAYDDLRQPVEVLKEVYHGVREALFDEYDDSDDA